ncbi:hypothetical protein B0H14DRAFT_3440520 [Mycena olivaceomarginata]|nr:hypothetical protein B0H14DRAFT_3440520 [Mycena olivaceomarginata]
MGGAVLRAAVSHVSRLSLFLIFLTRHVNDQGSSQSLSLQDEPHTSVTVPDREGDHTSDLPKHDESMDINIVHADVGVTSGKRIPSLLAPLVLALPPPHCASIARTNVWTLCGSVAQQELCVSHLAAVLYPAVPLAFHSGSSQDRCRSSHLCYRHLCRSPHWRPTVLLLTTRGSDVFVQTTLVRKTRGTPDLGAHSRLVN